MNITTEDINSIRNLTEKESLDLLKLATERKHNTGKRQHIQISTGLTQVDLFCYLAVRFGRPKGILSLLRKDDSDNLVHWHYTLSLNGDLVDILSFTYRIEVFLPEKYACTTEDFCTLLSSEIGKHAEQISGMKSKLEEWLTFLNPHKHLKNSAKRLLLRAGELESTLDKTLKHPVTESELREFSAAFRRNADIADELSGLCLSIKMMAPVIAESFINLLIFILAKPEIKKDEKRMESFLRKSIGDRLKALHKDCLHIHGPVDLDNPSIRDFLAMMTRRNDLLHGNVRPMIKTDEHIYFLEKTPLFSEWRSMFERALKTKIQAYTLADAQSDISVAFKFTEHLSTYLDPNVTREILAIAETTDLGFDIKRKILGRLFSNQLTDLIPRT